jgi:predicted dehydrogenase
MTRVRVGIIGCGKISDAYFQGCRAYDVLDVAACADLDPGRAAAKAAEHGVQAMGVGELLQSSEIDLVVNLTIPVAHAEVNRAALGAGKHAYCEKPFALDPAEGAAVLALASSRGLLVGCAPDTFLGQGLQATRAVLDSGVIGKPVAALATMVCRGHERWHPSPAFYYQRGGGPMFDMGPYYLTALVSFLGPAVAVTCAARASFPERTILSQPLTGQKIPVEVSTHYSASVRFAGGAVATLLMSFDAWPGPGLPHIALYGELGTLEAPDPNRFDGAPRLWIGGSAEPSVVAPAPTAERSRGTGVADMAYSILRRDRPFRASGALAQHVLEIMAACDASAADGREVRLATACARPAPVPAGMAGNVLDP